MDSPGAELRRQRRARGLSLRALGTRVIFDHSYIAAVERGDRQGSPMLAASVDEALHAHGRLVALFAAARVTRQIVVGGRDEATTCRAEDLADLVRRAGIVELPDTRPASSPASTLSRRSTRPAAWTA